MRILIYGAGPVGCYLGAHLAQAGNEVTLLGRDRLKTAIAKDSLTLQKADGSRHKFAVAVVTSTVEAFQAAPYEWIAFTMKAYDTVPAIFELQQATKTPPPIVTFQNGVGNEESLISAFDREKVVAGTLTSPVSMLEPGVVVEEKARGVALASDSAAASMVIETLRSTALPLTVIARTDMLKWSKLLLNIVGNASSAILDMHPREVFANPTLFGIEWAALREALYIMELLDIPAVNLPGAPARTLSMGIRYLPQALLHPVLQQKVATGRGDKLPSLLLALRTGDRRTEIAWLNGAVVQAADRLKRLAPINHALALTVSDIATGRVDWEMFRSQPDRLMSVIRTAQGLNH